jgi:hypothetical protein
MPELPDQPDSLTPVEAILSPHLDDEGMEMDDEVDCWGLHIAAVRTLGC